MPATTAGKMLPSAWARPLKKKAQKVTSAAARERSRLIIREASESASSIREKALPQWARAKKACEPLPAAALPAPLSLRERRLVRRERRAVTQVDPERPRVGEEERVRREGGLDRPLTEGARR